jgi:hypothetical protein
MRRECHDHASAVVRVTDQIGIGLLTRTYPPDLVDRAVAACGRAERRRRLLPARVMVYFVLALGLFFGQAYEEVARLLAEALAWRRWSPPWRVPTKSALAQARARLGPAPLRALYAQAVGPLATPATHGAFYRGWRLVAIDGTTLDVPDTPANATAFGRPGSAADRAAFPQVRLVGLSECGTHAIIAATLGPYRTGEGRLAADLTGALTGEMLLVDRGLFSYQLWRTMAEPGAALLWRAKTGSRAPRLDVEQSLADGSWLSRLRPTHRRRDEAIVVRVIDYRLDDPGRPQTTSTTYRLVTSLLDPAVAPAHELAALYHQRWELETTLDELKIHQVGPAGTVLRSKTPDGVAQEVWALLLVHYAIRALMHQAALVDQVDPDRLSFIRSLRVVRRSVTRPGGLSPPAAGPRRSQGHRRDPAAPTTSTAAASLPTRGQAQDEQLRPQTPAPSALATTDQAC